MLQMCPEKCIKNKISNLIQFSVIGIFTLTGTFIIIRTINMEKTEI